MSHHEAQYRSEEISPVCFLIYKRSSIVSHQQFSEFTTYSKEKQIVEKQGIQFIEIYSIEYSCFEYFNLSIQPMAYNVDRNIDSFN
jgi:hypothetical protein